MAVFTRPMSLFGRMAYFPWEQWAILSAVNDATRGLYLSIPEEFSPFDLPTERELATDILTSVAKHHGRMPPEEKEALAKKFLCRARQRLIEVGA